MILQILSIHNNLTWLQICKQGAHQKRNFKEKNGHTIRKKADSWGDAPEWKDLFENVSLGLLVRLISLLCIQTSYVLCNFSTQIRKQLYGAWMGSASGITCGNLEGVTK